MGINEIYINVALQFSFQKFFIKCLFFLTFSASSLNRSSVFVFFFLLFHSCCIILSDWLFTISAHYLENCFPFVVSLLESLHIPLWDSFIFYIFLGWYLHFMLSCHKSNPFPHLFLERFSHHWCYFHGESKFFLVDFLWKILWAGCSRLYKLPSETTVVTIFMKAEFPNTWPKGCFSTIRCIEISQVQQHVMCGSLVVISNC